MFNVTKLPVATFIFCWLLQAVAAASWGFSEASLSVQSKGAGVGAGLKEKYVLSFEVQ